MRYTLGLRDDGWLVVDTATNCIARFAGCDLNGLTRDEAATMAEMLSDMDRATQALAGEDREREAA